MTTLTLIFLFLIFMGFMVWYTRRPPLFHDHTTRYRDRQRNPGDYEHDISEPPAKHFQYKPQESVFEIMGEKKKGKKRK